uniref:Uncharacterized protein n=1 Tax=Arundo donax TaxID=35708 RepID=A0A0A8ZZS5_ARUDO
MAMRVPGLGFEGCRGVGAELLVPSEAVLHLVESLSSQIFGCDLPALY